jgi:RNA polymerase sigma-70 factor (ECF subfamily)
MITNIGSYLRKENHVPFELWARRVAINHIIDEFRKNVKHKENLDYRELQEAEDIHPTTDPIIEREKLEEILMAIEQLSQMSRTVFNLFVIDGYGHDEIAKMLKISSGTSKAHLHSAKKKLREMLDSKWKKKVLITNTVYQ